MRMLVLNRKRRHLYNWFRKFCTRAFYLTNAEFDEITSKYFLIVYAETREQALGNIALHIKKMGS